MIDDSHTPADATDLLSAPTPAPSSSARVDAHDDQVEVDARVTPTSTCTFISTSTPTSTPISTSTAVPNLVPMPCPPPASRVPSDDFQACPSSASSSSCDAPQSVTLVDHYGSIHNLVNVLSTLSLSYDSTPTSPSLQSQILSLLSALSVYVVDHLCDSDLIHATRRFIDIFTARTSRWSDTILLSSSPLLSNILSSPALCTLDQRRCTLFAIIHLLHHRPSSTTLFISYADTLVTVMKSNAFIPLQLQLECNSDLCHSILKLYEVSYHSDSLLSQRQLSANLTQFLPSFVVGTHPFLLSLYALLNDNHVSVRVGAASNMECLFRKAAGSPIEPKLWPRLRSLFNDDDISVRIIAMSVFVKCATVGDDDDDDDTEDTNKKGNNNGNMKSMNDHCFSPVTPPSSSSSSSSKTETPKPSYNTPPLSPRHATTTKHIFDTAVLASSSVMDDHCDHPSKSKSKSNARNFDTAPPSSPPTTPPVKLRPLHFGNGHANGKGATAGTTTASHPNNKKLKGVSPSKSLSKACLSFAPRVFAEVCGTLIRWAWLRQKEPAEEDEDENVGSSGNDNGDAVPSEAEVMACKERAKSPHSLLPNKYNEVNSNSAKKGAVSDDNGINNKVGMSGKNPPTNSSGLCNGSHRDTVAYITSIADSVGLLLHTLWDHMDSRQRDLVLRSYFSMATSTRLPIRRACAYNFPAIAHYYLSENQSASRHETNHIASVCMKLLYVWMEIGTSTCTNDTTVDDSQTRYLLAAGFFSVLENFTKYAPMLRRRLMGVYGQLLADVDPLVRTRAISDGGLTSMIRTIIMDEKRQDMESHLNDLFNKLRDVEPSVHAEGTSMMEKRNTCNWRAQLALVGALEECIDFIPIKFYSSHVLPLLYGMANHSSVSTQLTAMDTIAWFMSKLSNTGKRTDQLYVYDFFHEWTTSLTFRKRVNIVRCMRRALRLFEHVEDINCYVLPNLIALAVLDRTREVRLEVARTLVMCCAQLGGYAERREIQATVMILLNDVEDDVQREIRKVGVERLQRMTRHVHKVDEDLSSRMRKQHMRNSQRAKLYRTLEQKSIAHHNQLQKLMSGMCDEEDEEDEEDDVRMMLKKKKKGDTANGNRMQSNNDDNDDNVQDMNDIDTDDDGDHHLEHFMATTGVSFGGDEDEIVEVEIDLSAERRIVKEFVQDSRRKEMERQRYDRRSAQMRLQDQIVEDRMRRRNTPRLQNAYLRVQSNGHVPPREGGVTFARSVNFNGPERSKAGGGTGGGGSVHRAMVPNAKKTQAVQEPEDWKAARAAAGRAVPGMRAAAARTGNKKKGDGAGGKC